MTDLRPEERELIAVALACMARESERCAETIAEEFPRLAQAEREAAERIRALLAKVRA